MSDKKFNIMLIVGLLPFYINDITNSYFDGPLYWFVGEVFFILIPLFIYINLIRSKYMTNRDLGFTYIINPKMGIGLNLFLFILFLLILPIASYIFYVLVEDSFYSLFTVNYFDNPFDYFSKLPKMGFTHFLAVFVFSVTSGLTIEFYLRGMFFKFIENFSKKYLNKRGWESLKPFLYIFFSSLLYGLMHWSDGIIDICTVFFLGILFAVIYLKTKNLIILIYSHFLVDFLIFAS